jgi:hypothetical protein
MRKILAVPILLLGLLLSVLGIIFDRIGGAFVGLSIIIAGGGATDANRILKPKHRDLKLNS